MFIVALFALAKTWKQPKYPSRDELIKNLWYLCIQFSSVAQSCLTICKHIDYSTPGLPVHHQLLEFTKLMSIESVIPSNPLIFSCPLLLLPSGIPSIKVFSNESVLRIRWLKHWNFSCHYLKMKIKKITVKEREKKISSLKNFFGGWDGVGWLDQFFSVAAHRLLLL